VSLDELVAPWIGFAFRQIPADSPFGILDFRFAGIGANNRWNRQGERTLYLASDPGVVIAEFGRHVRQDRTPEVGHEASHRRIYRLGVSIAHALDLREPRLCDALSLRSCPACFLDRNVARATAGYLRQTTQAQALLVPSVAFLNDDARWVMALFLEKLPTEPSQFLTSIDVDGTLRLEPSTG
jgi:RES domain-containing protein